MIIVGIDPGSKESGFVVWDPFKQIPVSARTISNADVIEWIMHGQANENVIVAIEQIRGYGIVAGDDTFDTCEAVGAFELAARLTDRNPVKIPRKEIKRHLCGNTTTNDKYIRQSLINRFGEPGTKKAPGPLFGISGHMWAALAVGVVAADWIKEGKIK